MRESASAGVIWKCWSNISFRLDSAILLSASRRLPLYPKPSELQGRMELLVEAKPGYREWGCWDRGLKRPIEDLQTRCPPLSLLFVLTHPLTLFCWHPPPSLVPSVQPTLSTNLPHPFTTTILLLSSSVTVRSAPTDDSTT